MENQELNQQMPDQENQVVFEADHQPEKASRPSGIVITDPRVQQILDAKKLAAAYGARYKLRKKCEAKLRRMIKAGELPGFDVD